MSFVIMSLTTLKKERDTMHYTKQQFQLLMKQYDPDADWLAIYQNAEKGEKTALYIVAEALHANDKMEDYIQILRQLSNEGEAKAHYLLGNGYIEGVGVEENFEKALMHYEQAAKAGHADAMNNLADMYFNGEGTDVHLEAAYIWFTKAAEHDVPEAMFTLGIMHEQGLYVEEDIEKALQWYRQSAHHGYVEAYYYLGMIYLEGTHLQDTDITKAMSYFEKAEDEMHIDAIFNLGYIYENGLQGAIDGRRAVHYYKKAAFMGDDQARERLAEIYEEGYIVQRDLQQAKKWRTSYIMD